MRRKNMELIFSLYFFLIILHLKVIQFQRVWRSLLLFEPCTWIITTSKTLGLLIHGDGRCISSSINTIKLWCIFEITLYYFIYLFILYLVYRILFQEQPTAQPTCSLHSVEGLGVVRGPSLLGLSFLFFFTG